MARKTENAQQKAARKQRQKDRKDANKPLQSSQPSLPRIIPGTNTAQNQLAQSRRWLNNEQALKPRRFSHAAVRQVLVLFHKE